MSRTINWDPIVAIEYAINEDGQTQRQLAEQIGMDEVRLSKILNRKQRLLVDDLVKIAEAQGRDYDWYLGSPKVNRVNPRYLKSLVGRTTHPIPQLAA